DGIATLPADYTFVAGDNGTHTFSSGATLKHAGAQNVVATDTVTGSITGAQSGISVSPAAAAKLDLTGAVSNLASGGNRLFTATVEDTYGNAVTSDNSTVVTIAPTAGPGTLTGGGSGGVSNGAGSRTLTGVLAGSVTVTASAPGLTSGALTLAVV